MRLILALVTGAALACAGSASAETWKPYSAITPNNIQWSYDADYSYLDKASGRVVVLTAAGKVGADPRVGPSAPGAADGAGAVVAIDCKRGDSILMSGYSPHKPLSISDEWRKAVSHSVSGDADAKALNAAICPTAATLPTK